MAILNLTNAIEQMGDDKEIYEAVVETYLEDYVEVFANAKTAFDDKDGEALSRHAHSLKSSSRTVGGEDAGEVAFSLEKISKEGDFEESETLLKELSTQLELLKDALAEKGYTI